MGGTHRPRMAFDGRWGGRRGISARMFEKRPGPVCGAVRWNQFDELTWAVSQRSLRWLIPASVAKPLRHRRCTVTLWFHVRRADRPEAFALARIACRPGGVQRRSVDLDSSIRLVP